MNDFSEVQCVASGSLDIPKVPLKLYAQPLGGHTSYFSQGLAVGLLTSLAMSSAIAFGLYRFL